MAQGRSKSLWAHTATVMALHANIHRDRKRKSTPYKPSDFDPYHREKKEIPIKHIDVKDLKGMFSGLVERPLRGKLRSG
jgi:hypothetical protein